MDPKSFKPMNADMLLRLKPQHQAHKSVIFYNEDTSNNEIQHFEVIAVGPDVKHVAVGDHVIASWKRITPPFALEGTKKEYGITSEKEILAIIDD